VFDKIETPLFRVACSEVREIARLAIKHLSMSRLLALALFCVLTTAPAVMDAAQTLPTEVQGSGSSPVRIDSCRAALLDKPGPGAF
jgi:hypothetical protein